MVNVNDEKCLDLNRQKIDIKVHDIVHCRTNMDEEFGLTKNKSIDDICPVIRKISKHSVDNHAQSSKEKRQLISATALCFIFMLAEIVGGYMAGSLAIMSDAAHLLSDCISFIVALMAMCLSKKLPDKYMTFGYKRIEVFGAIISIFGIWLLTTFLFYFAINRIIYQDFEIDADTMIIVSIIGIVINVVMAIILHGEGLNCVPHTHSHGNNRTKYHNNNQSTTDYKPLLNEQQFSFAFRDNNTVECDSGRGSNVSATEYRRDNGVLKIDKNLSKSDKSKCIIDGITICPTHNYIHRDSSENTPLNSDSEDGRSFSSEHFINAYQQQHTTCSSSFSNKNINIQAAVIHVIGDFIQSIGVLISAIIIKYYPNAKIADPLCTFVFSIIVIMTTCTIMKESISIILEAVPASISVDHLTNDIECIEGVRSVHDLHVWSLTVGRNLMMAHLIIDPSEDSSIVLRKATAIALKVHNITHCTIQIESQRAQHETQLKPDTSSSIISIT